MWYCVCGDGAHHAWHEYIDMGLKTPAAREKVAGRMVPLTMLGGFRVDRYHPIEPF